MSRRGERAAAILVLAAVMLVLQAGATAQPGLSLDVEAFEVTGPNPLSERRTRRLLEPFTGQHDSIEPIREAASALESALRDEGYAFYVVSVPPQPVNARTIRLEITAFPVGDITVEGNEHFSRENILRGLPYLVSGESPDTDDISRSLRVANVHPRKRLRLRFATLEDEGGVPATIVVRDAKPLQLFLWANDTGTEATGEYRVGAGVQHGNLFDRDHVAVATWTTSPDSDEDVNQYGISYQVPMYRAGGLLSLLAARSDIDTGTVAEVFDVAGKGDALGVQYTQLLPVTAGVRHQVSIGIEDKLFDNDIDFLGRPIGVDVRSRPGYARYVASRQGDRFSWDVSAAVYRNLSGGSFNDDDDYAASRAGADSDWGLARLGAVLESRFGNGWSLRASLEGQYSGEPLIVGEQFSLAGVDAVRGFQERELTRDRGYYGSLQLTTPPLFAGIQLVAFADAATGRLRDPLPGEVAKETVTSAGLGLRWSWQSYASLALDWARVIDGADPQGTGVTRDGDERVHFNLLLRR